MTSKWYDIVSMKLAQHLRAVNRKLYCQQETVLSTGNCTVKRNLCKLAAMS